MSGGAPTTPDPAPIDAVVRLLADEDRQVFDACRARLLGWGPVVRPALETAARDAEPRVRVRARQLLRSLELRDWEVRFRTHVATLPEGPLQHELATFEAGVLLVDAIGRDRLQDVDGLREQVDTLGRRLRRRIEGRSGAVAARWLGRFLGEECGFRGRPEDYDDVNNALLDVAVRRRRGLPLTLALIYVLVGRRAGLRLHGVWMPGHFLVRVHGRRPVLLDPFHAGRQVTRNDCLRCLRSAGHNGPLAVHLADVSDRRLLDAMLDTLIGMYRRLGDDEVVQSLGRARAMLGQEV